LRAAPVLLASILVFCAIEGAVFHTGVYPWIISPDSSTGSVETVLRNERLRPKTGAQVLGIGDSRMLLEPRISNQHAAETGYTFGLIGTAGASPRSWYYMLREAAVLGVSDALGPVGGKIVANTFARILKRDAGSYLNAPTAFTPSSTVTVFPGSESETPGYHDQWLVAAVATALLRSSGVVSLASKVCRVGIATFIAPTR